MYFCIKRTLIFAAMLPCLTRFALPSDIASTSGTKPIPASPPFSPQRGKMLRSISSSSSSSSLSNDSSFSSSSSDGSFKSASNKSTKSSPSRTPPSSPPRTIQTAGLKEMQIYHDRIKGKVGGIYLNQIQLAREAKNKPSKAKNNRKIIDQGNQQIKNEDSKLFKKGFQIIQGTHHPDAKKMSLMIEPIQKIAYDFREGYVGTRTNPSPRLSHDKLDRMHKEATDVLLFGKPHKQQKGR